MERLAAHETVLLECGLCYYVYARLAEETRSVGFFLPRHECALKAPACHCEALEAAAAEIEGESAVKFAMSAARRL